MRVLTAVFCLLTSTTCAQVSVGTFDVDASPPIGSPMAYDPTKAITEPLSCRGIVILGADKPIVLCSVDWLGIANESHREFCERLANAAGTTPDRVSVHTIHQHDAPRCDFSAKEILDQVGLGDSAYDEGFCRSVFLKAAKAVEQAVKTAKPVTHLGMGQAEVKEVASNRRILGEDGKVKVTRYTACRDPKIRAEPVGTIDPMLKTISFWNGDKPVAVLTYYATHPQSYYRTGEANPDFPGMARNARQKELGVPHIHFNGAGGNIGAGKWNDGSRENRQVLADKVALGMKLAFEATRKTPITAKDIAWRTESVQLPPGEHLVEDTLLSQLKNQELSQQDRLTAAKHLAWLRRTEAKQPVTLSCLQIGDARVLHMPGELFVEYQLAAQKMAPEKFVAMAAYGEYGPGYIGTEIAYSQGGYEASDRASRVAGDVEAVLTKATEALLQAKAKTVELSGEICDIEDDPLADVALRVFFARDQFSKPVEVARTRTDTEGQYKMNVRVPELGDIEKGESPQYWVIATRPGFAIGIQQSWAGDAQLDRLSKYTSWPLLPANRIFHGVIVNQTGQPVEGALVHFQRVPVWAIPGIRCDVTDENGRFEIRNLHSYLTEEEESDNNGWPRGWPHASVSHRSYGTQTFEHAPYKSPVKWTMERSVNLSGSVVDHVAGSPAVDEVVQFIGARGNYRQCKTDENGLFRATVPADTYCIYTKKADRVCKYLIRQFKPGQIGKLLPIRLTQGALVRGRIFDDETGELLKPPTGKTLSIRAYAKSNERMKGREPVRSVRVESDSSYQIRLPTGAYRFQIQCGSNTQWVQRVAVAEGEEYREDLTLPARSEN